MASLTRFQPGLAIPAVALAALVLGGACVSSQSVRRSPRPVDLTASVPTTGKEAADYREIQALYSKAQYDLAIQKLDSFERKHPRSSHLAHARNLKGLCFLLTRRPHLAAVAFKKSVEVSPNANFRQYVLYNQASAEFESNQMEEARATLTEVQPDLLDRENRIKFYSLRCRVAMKTGQKTEAVRDLLLIGKLLEGPAVLKPYTSLLEQALQDVTDSDALEQVYRDNDSSALSDLVLYRLASMEAAQGRAGSAESHLRALLDRFPRSSRADDAQELQRSLLNQSAVNASTVGVLLPMKGKFARFGHRTLQAIELAFGIFNADQPDSNVTLVVEDSGEDAESSTRALNTLFFKHRVSAVIGPLLSKGIEQVANRAQELGVPLISLAQQPATGEFIFPSALTPQAQAREIARYAIETQGLKRFAVLHPRDRFGEQYAQAFWDAVEELGGSIVGVESYAPNETDFRQPIDKLSGLFYQEARQRELDELAKEREEKQIKKRNRRTEQYFALKPIVDYEAVFVPDEPRVVGQILPTFAYRDVKGVKFLGIATWHSADLLARAQNHAEGSFFVDAFFPEGGQPTATTFLNRYRATYNQDPAAMEALAYDAALVLDAALKRGSISSRGELRDRLRSTRSFPGVTGRISFADGQLHRGLSVLTIRGGHIVAAPAR